MARKKHNIHYIYKTTCNVTNRYYVGMHSTSNIDDGYMGSGLRLRRSIRKYGKDNHTKEILEFVETREELAKREKEIVNKQFINEKLCMNLTIGGEAGGFKDKEHMTKCSKAGKLAFLDKLKNEPEFKIKMKRVANENLQKARDEGKMEYDNFKGKTHSEETLKKMSESKKGQGSGKTNSQFGKCWITNGKENKKMTKGHPLPIGWRFGRVMK